jgi:cell division septum initiation protein DivIVA
MTTFNVSIPDNKISFFQEFLDMIGARYEKKQEEIELTEKQKKTLDKALEQDKKTFISRDDISRKYKL